MKRIFFLLLPLIVAIGACSKVKNGDDFVGSWRAEGDTKPANATFYIADRLIVDKDVGGNYTASLLAQGVFTKMTFEPSKGYLCTEKGACFEMVDKNTIRIGSKTGIKTYKREQ